MVINLTIAGGCFTEQHNIPFEKLYHQILKNCVEKKFETGLNIGIIRYERFTMCLDKIKNFSKENPADILLFHIRSEPFLRLCKLYYKYTDNNEKRRHSINIPFLNFLNPEKFDMLKFRNNQLSVNPTPEDYFKKKSVIHNFLVSLNYFSGLVTGNVSYALKNYLNLVNDVIAYCEEKEIKLIILGPVSRPHTISEEFLTLKLHRFMKNSIDTKKISYVSSLGKFSEENKSLFFNNGIHVNETGHRRIAELILSEFNNIFECNNLNYKRHQLVSNSS